MPKALRYHLLSGRLSGPQDLAGGSAALTLAAAAAPVQAHVRLLDSFDGALCLSGRLLLHSGGRLHLFEPRACCCQPAGGGGLVSALPDGPVRRVLERLCPLRRLLPLAEGRLSRYTLSAARRGKPRGQLTVLALEMPCGTASLLVSRLSGRKTARALDARLAALGATPAAPAALYALLAPERPRGRARPGLPLAAGQPAGEAAWQIIQAQLAAARENEPGIISELDTEFLHGYRIALRRTRALLAGMKGVLPPEEAGRLRRGLAALMDKTGALRDLDVWLLEEDSFRARLPAPLHPGHGAVFAAIRAERGACQRALAGHLISAAYHWQMAGLSAQAASAAARPQGGKAARPIGPLARKLILKRHAKLCARAARITGQSADAEIHALRIGCKKLRYLLELFAPLFPAKDLARALKPLKRLQNQLGRFHDCAQQAGALMALAARGFGSPEGGSHPNAEQAALAAGAMIALLLQEQQAARAGLGPQLKAFTSPAAQARFRKLCKDG